ncbi:MAG: hypothetical protein M5T61_11590 [Acidimicrobiia bacterium]|nr:hypothetical protein [Acidimicrobiia bacterium]
METDGERTQDHRRIIRVAWVADGVFAATSIPYALGIESLERASVAVDLTLFLVSLPVWVYAFLVAVGRTARGDDIAVASLFFLQRSAPRSVRVSLLGALAVCLGVTALTAKSNPFGVLVPMLPLGLAGLWGALHGTYPPRPARSGGARRSHGRSGE